MFIFTFILLSCVIINNSKDVINIGDLLRQMELLEKLEKRVSESISDGKFFEHSKLSLNWYDKFIHLYWNTTSNKLYLNWDGERLDVKNIIDCGFNNNCLFKSSYLFNSKYMLNNDYIDFIIGIKKIVETRLRFLYQNMFVI